MEYLKQKFSVCPGRNKNYRDNFDKVFGKDKDKDEDEVCLVDNFLAHQQTLPLAQRMGICLIHCRCKKCNPFCL